MIISGLKFFIKFAALFQVRGLLYLKRNIALGKGAVFVSICSFMTKEG